MNAELVAAIRRRRRRELVAEMRSKSRVWKDELARQIMIFHGRPGTPERQRWNANAPDGGLADYDYGDPGPPSSPEIEAELLAWRRARGW